MPKFGDPSSGNFIKMQDVTIVRLLSDEFATIWEHYIKDVTGNAHRYVCLGKSCPICKQAIATGDKELKVRRSNYVPAIEGQETVVTMTNGKKGIKTELLTAAKIFKFGMKIEGQLHQIALDPDNNSDDDANKNGIMNRTIKIVRTKLGQRKEEVEYHCTAKPKFTPLPADITGLEEVMAEIERLKELTDEAVVLAALGGEEAPTVAAIEETAEPVDVETAETPAVDTGEEQLSLDDEQPVEEAGAEAVSDSEELILPDDADEPVAKPVTAKPVAAAKPAAKPVAKPVIAKPVAKPVIAKPVAKPVARKK